MYDKLINLNARIRRKKRKGRVPYTGVGLIRALRAGPLRRAFDTVPAILFTYVSPALCKAVDLVLVLTVGGGDVAVQFGLGDQLGHQLADVNRDLAAGAHVREGVAGYQ